MLWLNDARSKIKSGLKDASATNVTKQAAQLWKTFSQDYRDSWSKFRLNLVAKRDGDTKKFEKPEVFAAPVKGLVDYESDEE